MKTQLTVLVQSMKGIAIFHIYRSLLTINKYIEDSSSSKNARTKSKTKKAKLMFSLHHYETEETLQSNTVYCEALVNSKSVSESEVKLKSWTA